MQNLSKQIINKFTFVLGIFIFLASCNRELIPVNECCPDIEPSKQYSEFTYIYDTNLYGYPRFSPADTIEFIYLDLYNEEQGDLYKFNILDSTSQFLTSNVTHSPNWSQRDWIAFNVLNKIWIIKSNGDSLQQMYPLNSNYYPTWSPDGKVLLFKTTYENFSRTYFGDLSGNLIDSIDLAFSNGAWSPDSIKVATPLVVNENFGVYYVNLIDKNIIKILETGNSDGNIHINGIDWMPDSHSLIWANGSGVYNSTIDGLSTTQIICNCDVTEYIHPSVSHDGSKLLLEKITRSKISENTIFEDHSIVIMNIDGTNEVTILE